MQTAVSIDTLPVPEPWKGSADPLARQRYLEALGEEIAGLSAHIEAATWRLLRSISEFDRLQGWELGFTSCAHWLSWRCHYDMITAREKVRVARALDTLPQISEALRTGRVSYSKVRAMTRAATPANEKELLHIALNGTACHVERVVRGLRRAREGESLEDIRRRHEERSLRIYIDAQGMTVIQARLPPETGAVVRKALEAALEQVRQGENEKENTESPKSDQGKKRSCACPEYEGDRKGVPVHGKGNSTLLTVPSRFPGESIGKGPASLPGSPGDPFSDETRPRHPAAVCSLPVPLRRELATFFRADREGPGTGGIPRPRLHPVPIGLMEDSDGGEWVLVETPEEEEVSLPFRPPACSFPPVEAASHDSAELSSVDSSRSNNNRILKPVSDDSAELLGDSTSREPPPDNPTHENRERLRRIQDKNRETLDQLRADALGLMAEAALGDGLASRERGEPFQVVVHVEAGVLSGTSGQGHCELEDGTGVSAESCRRLACDAPVLPAINDPDGTLLQIGRKTRKISTPLWRFLQERDRHCRFPGCTRTGRLQAHHIRHWARGGDTSPQNTLLVCRAHHWAVHEGGYRIQVDDSGEPAFFRPDGSRIPEVPPRPGVPPDPMEALRARNRRSGLEISPETSLPGWGGEELDVVWAVEGILQAEKSGKPE